MSTVAHTNEIPALQIKGLSSSRERGLSDTSLSLRATGDGWALMSASGRVVFSALGVSGRRMCLEFARAAGVLSVRS